MGQEILYQQTTSVDANRRRGIMAILARSGMVLLTMAISLSGLTAVLPEDRADMMYHSYDGGGVKIDGPSMLVRKSFAGVVSLSANYYVDHVSSASIDVVASGASKYTEEREEKTVGVDYLNDKTMISTGFTNSEENDYTADTGYLSISQDFFGDLSTISLGYSRGDDEVSKNHDESFEAQQIDRQNFRFGFSQIITPKMLAAINYEAVTEEGYLNNPYRFYLYIDPNNSTQVRSATEVYPNTRTSDAVALRLIYYFEHRATLLGEYRHYTDDWDVESGTYLLKYTHTFDPNWIMDVKFRTYSQDQAGFYADVHSYESQNDRDYRARDKELSEFSSNTFGLAFTYQFSTPLSFVEKSSVSLDWERIEFDYDNFSDASDPTMPLYSFDADVIRLYLSIWY